MSTDKTIGQTHEDVHHSSFTPERVFVVPVDGSKDSEYALQWTIDNLIDTARDQIVILNVRPQPLNPLAVASMTQTLEETNKAASHKLLLDAANAVQAQNVHVRAIALQGDARDELVYKIEQIKPLMVVVGSRGLGQISRALLGSVSDYLVRHLQVPVLVAHKPKQ
ncbi:hypothetical protein EDD86DRAFT_199695 [Gorgonomyces haynaldii]|nr:hypothetical protein EDD86DRAFT_199695 [Gorgonomyces haynaldii]